MTERYRREDVLIALDLPPYERGRIAQLDDAGEREAEKLDTQASRVLQLISTIEAYREMALSYQCNSRRRKRIYIAGPMSGYPKFNYPAFHEAERKLRDAGYIPVSPAKEHQVSEDGDDFAEGATYQDCLRDALRSLLTCDGVALLPGWAESKGARLEFHVATTLGLDVRVFTSQGFDVDPSEYWLEG